MAKGLVIRNGMKLLGTLGVGTGNPLLTLDPVSSEVEQIPSIDTSAYITSALTSSFLLVGNASNVATPRNITGQVLISNLGVTSIATDTIIDANINSAAGIQYSKLNLANSIVNNDIAANANIVRTKIIAGTANRILINDGSGVFSEQTAITANRVIVSDSNGLPVHSSVTTTTLSYLDATSSIQTQLNNRLSFSSGITPANGDVLIYSGGSWINLGIGTAGQVLTVSAGLPTWAASSVSGILPTGGTANQYLRKVDGTNYNTTWDTLTLSKITDVTATVGQVNVLGTGYYDATSSVQGQLNSKLDKTLQQNYIFVGNASNVATGVAPGANGYILTSVGGVPTWVAPTGGGTVTSVAASGGSTGLSFTGSPITGSGTLTLTGTLAVGSGGTGLASYTAGDLIYATGTTTLSKLGIGTNGYVLTVTAGAPTWQPAAAGGVTSVGLAAPAIFSVSGSPVTTSGTLTLALATQAANTVFAGPTSGGAVAPTFRALVSTDIPDLSATYQPLDADLTAIAALGFTSTSFLKKTAANTWALDTNTYLTANQTITLSSEATGSGTTSIAVTLSNAAVIGKVLTGFTSGAGTVSATDSILQAIQKLDGNAATKWSLVNGGTLTGVNTITSNTANQLNFTGTFTATANNQYLATYGGTFTARATVSDMLAAVVINPSLIAAAGSQVLQGLRIDPTFTPGAFSPTRVVLQAGNDNTFVRIAQNSATDTFIQFRNNSSTGVFRMDTAANYFGVNAGFGTTTLQLSNNVGVNGATDTNAPLIQRTTGSVGSSGITYTGTNVTAGISHLFGLGSWAGTSGLFTVIGHNNTWTASTGTASVSLVGLAPTLAFSGSHVGTFIGFDYNPASVSLAAGTTHIAFRATSGSIVLGAINNDNALTQVIVRDSGTGELKYRTAASLSGAASPPAVSTVTTSTTLTVSGIELVVLGDTSGGNITTTLPTAVGNAGYKYVLKKISASNTWTIDANSTETIDGGLTATIIVNDASITIVSDGANWRII